MQHKSTEKLKLTHTHTHTTDLHKILSSPADGKYWFCVHAECM